jgi:hypothetical protein
MVLKKIQELVKQPLSKQMVVLWRLFNDNWWFFEFDFFFLKLQPEVIIIILNQITAQ